MTKVDTPCETHYDTLTVARLASTTKELRHDQEAIGLPT
jgi:hypothetical protein